MNPSGVENNLLLHYSFDDEVALDKSGNKHWLVNPPGVGPENGGKGYSGYYDGQLHSLVEHHPMFEL